MSAVSQTRLHELIARFETVEARLGATSKGEEIARLSREHTELAPVAQKARTLLAQRQSMIDATALTQSEDAELAALARSEQAELKRHIETLEQDMQILLLPKDRNDEADVVLEIRAGTGGDEAALFAGDLFRMYQRYASVRGWSFDVSSVSEGEAGGYKEIIIRVAGAGVYGRWKYESGVHRVQRVPQTESGGRIHTSAATIAVLPSPKEIDMQIRPNDLRIETFRASGAGGQHVNKTDSAVRMTHIPTGICAASSEKSQHYNRARALEILQARLYERERTARDTEQADARKTQVGSGDRSQRIRTYNFPEKRVSDHRIGLTLHKLDTILNGNGLEEIIEALSAEEQSRLLLEMQAQG